MTRQTQLTTKRTLVAAMTCVFFAGIGVGTAIYELSLWMPARHWVGSLVFATLCCIGAAKYGSMLLNTITETRSAPQ